MEIELKYTIPSVQAAKEIAEDGFLLGFAEGGSWQDIPMKAVYYDTPDYQLREKGVAFRVRQEGGETIAAMKLMGRYADGLHRREEINIPITTRGTQSAPRAGTDGIVGGSVRKEEGSVFGAGSQGIADLSIEREPNSQQILSRFMDYEVFRERRLEPSKMDLRVFLETDMLRRRLLASYRNCRLEAAVDSGVIRAAGRQTEILELELELIEGSEEDLRDLGKQIQRRFTLLPEIETKFSRGLRLYNEA